ncbi:MAG: efflux RND transporter periplasmic adaptor subunit [Acidobacteria bacterium]|nr:efflux RND transporter periplasmic adaptor subunit [Acidobacteriota bacterium]
MKHLKDVKTWIILVLALWSGWLLFRPDVNEVHSDSQTAEKVQIWTCSMHPQIRLNAPGSCPICGMDLIPASSDDHESGPWELSLSPQAMKLAQIQTSTVRRSQVPHEVRMVGKVQFDEKRVRSITAWTAGRIERLYVDYTGIEVKSDDHMVDLYSPQLVTAQRELQQAQAASDQASDATRESAQKRLDAAKRKLELLGLNDTQIKALTGSQKSTDTVTINAPSAGVVIQKHLNEGAYVQVGSPIYTIADLSRVWVVLEAYESDLVWLRYGQEVEFYVEAYPGKSFKGRIVFIDPTLDPKTRTIRVRLDLPNQDGLLKPDMFVRASVFALLSPIGKVMDPSLKGKWISRMHPEVVKDKPGKCDVCGMDLVPAESLGFDTSSDDQAPLLIPDSAPLITGKRAIVYVESVPGIYEGREIVLGPRVEGYYAVVSGLTEGERVVSKGAFKIDSELQIQAKYSMMYHPSSQASETAQDVSVPAEFVASLSPLIGDYLELHRALSEDDLNGSQQIWKRLGEHLLQVDHGLLGPAAMKLWHQQSEPMTAALNSANAVMDLDAARVQFDQVTTSLTTMLESFGVPEGLEIMEFHCPMALGRGANWLQNTSETANPYYGSAMYSCGSMTRQLGDSHEGHAHE